MIRVDGRDVAYGKGDYISMVKVEDIILWQSLWCCAVVILMKEDEEEERG